MRLCMQFALNYLYRYSAYLRIDCALRIQFPGHHFLSQMEAMPIERENFNEMQLRLFAIVLLLVRGIQMVLQAFKVFISLHYKNDEHIVPARATKKSIS